MDTKAFSFNRGAKYQAGGVYDRIVYRELERASVRVKEEASFETEFPDVFHKYRLPKISSDKLVQAWNNRPMQFWQNQVNFAVWGATTGCGVSVHDHLQASESAMRSLYSFHVYYQIRRILAEIQAPLPQDQAWSALENPYDRRAYERICSEFGVSPHADWRRHGVNRGLGKVYNYWTNNGYHPVGDGDYDAKAMSFTKATTNDTIHVDYIEQGVTAETAWSEFTLDKSHGFTHAGVERLNDSIRTYVWAILGAQALTRTRILGTGTAFDAQKQFLANVEDAISSPVDLPAAIKRYQDVLQYADSKVDFVFGIGLYMAPSDMLLRVSQAAGYNNEIVVATQSQKLGVNKTVNVSQAPPDVANETGENGLIKHEVTQSAPPPPGAAVAPVPAGAVSSARQHVDEKTALIVGGVGVGLLALWAFGRL